MIKLTIPTRAASKHASPHQSLTDHSANAMGGIHITVDVLMWEGMRIEGKSRAILKTHSTILHHRALILTLVPKLTLPDHHPEIVFVADGSKSIKHNVANLKWAMKIFLKSLPFGTPFNICSFGTPHEFLWLKSKQYMPETMEEALRKIESFDDNYEDTEILEALAATIERRFTDLPLEIMLLTDDHIKQKSKYSKYLNIR